MFENNIPTTKKMPRKITKKRLENIALYYLQRYESSVENLRGVLKKRVLKYKMAVPDFNSAEAHGWIEEILQKLQDLHYLDDARYAEMKIDSYIAAGKPARYIQIKLKEKGISREIVDSLLLEKSFSPLEMALKFAKKKSIGPFAKSEEQRKENRQKDLGKLVRAGFDYDIALKVLEMDESEILPD